MAKKKIEKQTISKKQKVKKTVSSKDKDINKLPSFPAVLARGFIPIPGMVIALIISDQNEVNAIEKAYESDSKKIVVLCLKNQEVESIETLQKNDFSEISAICQIINVIKMPSGELRCKIALQQRFRLSKLKHVAEKSGGRIAYAFGEDLGEDNFIKLSKANLEQIQGVKQNFVTFLRISRGQNSNEDEGAFIEEVVDPGQLSDLVTLSAPFDPADAILVLEELDPLKRLQFVEGILKKFIQHEVIREKVTKRVEDDFSQLERKEFIREQIKALKQELGEEQSEDEEIDQLKDQLEKANLPDKIKEEVSKQIKRLRQLHPDTSESALARTYIDWILDLPWSKRSEEKYDLEHVKRCLDEDHFGLEKVKDRILDYLSVKNLKKDVRGPILMFVGPPGVGKTTLGRSIARAIGREFVRVSVGGLRDEAELRGHRRTYVGAMPGRIIQGIKTAGTKNPIFMFDELDKIGSDYRGDPSAVMLEILDPEQNRNFEDHYLNIPFDLSEVMFICTANMLDSIPAPLHDRLEVIELSGYTDEEKIEIAKKYIVPDEKNLNGVNDIKITINDDILQYLISSYTRESGVRDLRRQLAKIFRKCARMMVESKNVPEILTKEMIRDLLGSPIYLPEEKLREDQVGVVTGLAWTSQGGEIMPIEVTMTKGKGTLNLTGHLGDVMKESAMAALTCVLSRAEEFGFDSNIYETSSIHVHVPNNAVPKDGPSAGIAIATALVSIFTGKRISSSIAMTGEVTLRGNVMQIGGLKEKALGAQRAGIKKILYPKSNSHDLNDFPKKLLKGVEFVAVESIKEVIDHALIEKELKSSVITPKIDGQKPKVIDVHKRIKI